MHALIAIEFDSPAQYREALDIAMHRFDEVEEDFNHCVNRERGLEAYLLRQSDIPFAAFDRAGRVLDTNVNLEALDRSQWRLLCRSRSRMFEGVTRFDSLLTDEDNRTVERWPEVLVEPERFLGRKVSYFNKTAFFDKLLSGDMSYPVFVKGSDKGPMRGASLRHIFATPESLAEVFVPTRDVPERFQEALNHAHPFSLRFQSPDWYCEYRESMERGMLHYVPVNVDIITSELMNISRDGQGDSGTLEFRCFVFNGTVCSASRYTDYVSLPVPADLLDFASDFAHAQQQVLPIAYVVDIADTDEGYKVIELNQVPWSGRYLDNDPMAFFRAIHDHYNTGATYQRIEPMEAPAAESADDEILALSGFIKD